MGTRGPLIIIIFKYLKVCYVRVMDPVDTLREDMHLFLMTRHSLRLSVMAEGSGLPYKVVCFSSLLMPRMCVAALSKS